MDSRKEKIWDNIATINVPDCFKVSTIGEIKDEIYGDELDDAVVGAIDYTITCAVY